MYCSLECIDLAKAYVSKEIQQTNWPFIPEVARPEYHSKIYSRKSLHLSEYSEHVWSHCVQTGDFLTV